MLGQAFERRVGARVVLGVVAGCMFDLWSKVLCTGTRQALISLCFGLQVVAASVPSVVDGMPQSVCVHALVGL